MTRRFASRGRYCPICEGMHFETVFIYTDPPPREIRFASSSAPDYYREEWRCKRCGHFISVHEMDLSSLYLGDYVTANYTDTEGLRRRFDKIAGLPPEKSDNESRVLQILKYAKIRFIERSKPPSILDIGSGLCVFLNRMKKEGWDCTALDPDERAVAHARDTVGVKAIAGDFAKTPVSGHFDVITLNKVLEHVADPVTMLRKASELLAPGGFMYIELPDGEQAAEEGKDREEFTIDHLHVFSLCSTERLFKRAGLTPKLIERVREPSTKVTLRIFATR